MQTYHNSLLHLAVSSCTKPFNPLLLRTKVLFLLFFSCPTAVWPVYAADRSGGPLALTISRSSNVILHKGEQLKPNLRPIILGSHLTYVHE
jgi:hypothetical protein